MHLGMQQDHDILTFISLLVCRVQDAFEDDESVHLVMQLCEGGALFERIETKRYSEKYIVQIVRSILRFISQVSQAPVRATHASTG